MLVALWSWRHGAELIQLAGVEKPDLAEWSVRCGAVAVAAIAQAVLLTFVIGAVFRRDAVTDTLRLLAVILFLLAISAALALGIAGR